MADRVEDGSSPGDEYLHHVVQVMRENNAFLRGNAKEVLDEVVRLINDAIDYVSVAVKRREATEEYVKSAMVFFLQHVLMPFSYALYAEALAANLPACFMQIRLVVESLALCYLADARYPDLAFFEDKLKRLEADGYRASRCMKEVDAELGLEDEFIRLWGRLSGDWIHTRGVVGKVVDSILVTSEVPAWALVIPMSYAQSDLETLEELRKRVSQLRGLLSATTSAYGLEVSTR